MVWYYYGLLAYYVLQVMYVCCMTFRILHFFIVLMTDDTS